MEKLTAEEIQNIAQLILSPTQQNVQLALELLEHHRYAILDIKDQVTVFALFNLEENFLTNWLFEILPELDLKTHPVFPLAEALRNEYFINYLTDLEYLEKAFAAQEKYEAYLVADLSRAEAYWAIAKQLKSQFPNNYSLVIPYYRKARKYFPNNHQIAFNLSHSLHYNPSPFELVENYQEEVLNGYQQAYDASPLAKALYAMATFYHDNVKDEKKAEEFYLKCIEKHPEYPFAYNGYADLLMEKEDYSLAKKFALEGLKLVKNERGKEHILDTLGYVEWKGFQNYTAAEKYFEQAVAINYHHWESIIGPAEMFFEIEDYSNALKWYEIALERQPRNTKVLYALAFSCHELHRFDEAKRYYNLLLALVPDSMEMVVQLKKKLN